MLAAPGRNRGRHSLLVVIFNMVVAHDAAQTLILIFVQIGARQVGLEGALGPIVRVGSLVARGALKPLEVRAIIVSQGHH